MGLQQRRTPFPLTGVKSKKINEARFENVEVKSPKNNQLVMFFKYNYKTSFL